MALRSTSGKFGLPSFGRRRGSDSQSQPQSRIVSSATAPPAVGGAGSGDNDSLASPTTGGHFNFSPSHNHTSSSGGALDGISKKLGKKVAHTSLLPALGNQDLRTLQDVINSEKDVLKASDKVAQETSSAAAKLAPYGQREGPDLQDVLTHSATLLTQLSNAYHTFAGHEAKLRVCFKRIREREEKLEEMRRSRRTMTSKAETAERKLSKMGAENKQLLQQTELLERLRTEMRNIDAEIVVEESKLGDFKRQMVKEAMSYKFGGLEELGEKMCIVGELGKLLLEEIPLEETPPGYSRAPYEGYTSTDKTAKEALRCLAQVQFHAASAAPKPPGLPGINNSPLQQAAAGNGPVPEAALAQREAFGDYVPGTRSSSPHSPHTHTPGSPPRLPSLAGLGDRSENEYGATHAPTAAGVVWQGPPDDASDHEHGYEYEQQRELDAQREREQRELNSEATPAPAQGHARTPSFGAPIAERFATTSLSDPPATTLDSQPASPAPATPGWEPLRVSNRDSAGAALAEHQPRYSLHDGPRYSLHDGPGYTTPAAPADQAARESEPVSAPAPEQQQQQFGGTHADALLSAPAHAARPVTADGYYTPDDESVVAIPAPYSPPRSAEGLAYDDAVVSIPDVPEPGARSLPPVPQSSPPVVVIHEKSTAAGVGSYDSAGYASPAGGAAASPAAGGYEAPGYPSAAGGGAGGYRPPASPPLVASPEDGHDVHSALDSYYASSPADEKRASAGYVPAPSNGKMSAAAFRRGAKQRPSFNEDDHDAPRMPPVPQGYRGAVPESPPPGYTDEHRP